MKETSKWVTTDNIRLFIQLATIVIGLALSYVFVHTQIAVMQKDIDLLMNNHVVHLQNSIIELRAEVKSDMQEIKNDIKELTKLVQNTH